jgi:hypothetical protein
MESVLADMQGRTSGARAYSFGRDSVRARVREVELRCKALGIAEPSAPPAHREQGQITPRDAVMARLRCIEIAERAGLEQQRASIQARAEKVEASQRALAYRPKRDKSELVIGFTAVHHHPFQYWRGSKQKAGVSTPQTFTFADSVSAMIDHNIDIRSPRVQVAHHDYGILAKVLVDDEELLAALEKGGVVGMSVGSEPTGDGREIITEVTYTGHPGNSAALAIKADDWPTIKRRLSLGEFHGIKATTLYKLCEAAQELRPRTTRAQVAARVRQLAGATY